MNKLDLIEGYIRKKEQERYKKQRERVRELLKKNRIEEERKESGRERGNIGK